MLGVAPFLSKKKALFRWHCKMGLFRHFLKMTDVYTTTNPIVLPHCLWIVLLYEHDCKFLIYKLCDISKTNK